MVSKLLIIEERIKTRFRMPFADSASGEGGTGELKYALEGANLAFFLTVMITH